MCITRGQFGKEKPPIEKNLEGKVIQKLQEIKPYYAYKGRTWTALDMAIRALAREEEDGEEDQMV
jgi:hypothetical protein